MADADSPQRPFTARFQEGPAATTLTPSTPSSLTTSATDNEYGISRIPNPTPYDGVNKTAAAVRQWICAVEIYFDAIGLPEGSLNDEKRVLKAATFLKDDAAQWYYDKYRPMRPRGANASWKHFLAAVLAKFEPVSVTKSARIELRQHSQGTRTVAEYNFTFGRLTSQIASMDEEDKVDYYI